MLGGRETILNSRMSIGGPILVQSQKVAQTSVNALWLLDARSLPPKPFIIVITIHLNVICVHPFLFPSDYFHDLVEWLSIVHFLRSNYCMRNVLRFPGKWKGISRAPISSGWSVRTSLQSLPSLGTDLSRWWIGEDVLKANLYSRLMSTLIASLLDSYFRYSVRDGSLEEK